MDKDRWQQVSRLFEAAIELETQDQRKAFLSQQCGSDDDLRQEVEALLEAYPITDEFLETPPHVETQHAITEQLNIRLVGEQLGVWHIDNLIHYGGMGAVFRAHRVGGEFDQVAAVKVIQAGHSDNPPMLQKFTQERALLAQLEHHNIARLLDGGTTDDGFSYLVMEYVRGVPIDRWSSDQQLNTNQRIDLFIQVCNAVQYAHRFLIVHQDIKPNNILINPDGLPKLLDFGIARLLSDDIDADRQKTQQEPHGVTPGYSSPEQIHGDNITVATDIYSLGKLLSKLLTDSSQADASIADTDISSDLKAIISKATQEQPENRYTSVDSLLNDLQRFRKHWPVKAMPDSLAYRCKKFMRRHWQALGAIGIVSSITAIGVGATYWQSRIAQERFDQLHTLTESLLFNVHDSIADLSGSTKSRELIASNTLVYLDALANDANDDPELLLSLAENYFRLGDVVGNPTNANLGDAEAALQHYQHALEIMDKLLINDPGNTRYLYNKAAIIRGVGDVQMGLNQTQAALLAFQEAEEGFAELRRLRPERFNLTFDYVGTLVRLGDLSGHELMINLGQSNQARTYYQQGLDTLNATVPAAQNTQAFHRYQALLYERLGQVELDKSNISAAQKLFMQSKAARLALLEQYPNQIELVRDAGIAYEKMGHIYQQLNQPAEALEEYLEAAEIYQQLADTEPGNDNAQLTLAIGLEYVADGYRINGQSDQAQNYYHRSLALYEERAQRNPGNSLIRQKQNRAQSKLDLLIESYIDHSQSPGSGH